MKTKYLQFLNENINNDRSELLSILHNTYCVLKPSPLHGIGVFAIRDIPEGINPFGKEDLSQWTYLEPDEINKLDDDIKEVIKTYCVKQNGKYCVPKYGFHNRLGIANYLNNSDTPNIESINNGEEFRTLRRINKGEELLIDYDEIGEED